MKEYTESLPTARYKYTRQERSKIDPDYFHTKVVYRCPMCGNDIGSLYLYDKVKCIKCSTFIKNVGNSLLCTIKEK